MQESKFLRRKHPWDGFWLAHKTYSLTMAPNNTKGLVLPPSLSRGENFYVCIKKLLSDPTEDQPQIFLNNNMISYSDIISPQHALPFSSD
jgi:hypothetical protein